ncbi:roadblock/LC7 domain-containing protein [Streptomyces lavendulae]|uniref:roadblock/LC7 domain-containing protein n=1 Tax=Streptomyces lavendulae TaxID=1914 RepID=UPI0036A416B9
MRIDAAPLPEAPPPPPHLAGRRGTRTAREFIWVLQKFQAEVPGVFDVAVVSADGLLLARASDPHAPTPELVAPMTSGLAALAHATAQLHGSGRIRRAVLEMRHGIFAVVGISDGSLLAVAAHASTDRSVLGFQMTRLVRRVGHVLTAELRSTLRDHAATDG